MGGNPLNGWTCFTLPPGVIQSTSYHLNFCSLQLYNSLHLYITTDSELAISWIVHWISCSSTSGDTAMERLRGGGDKFLPEWGRFIHSFNFCKGQQARQRYCTPRHICWDSCNFPFLSVLVCMIQSIDMQKNNIERGRRAKGYRVGVFITVSQLIMSGSVGPCEIYHQI